MEVHQKCNRNVKLLLGSTVYRHAPEGVCTSLRFWLGVALFSLDSVSKLCSCSHHLDRFGDHLLSLGQGDWRTWHHEALCDVILHQLLVDNAKCRKEQRCSSDNSMRPGDVFRVDFEQGLPTYFNVTVRNSLQPLYIVKLLAGEGR